MIIDFLTRAAEMAGPKYSVDIQFYPRIGKRETAADLIERVTTRQLIESETATINNDEIGFDRQKIEYFRYALLGQLEHVQRGDKTSIQFDSKNIDPKKIEFYLYSEFGEALQKGYNRDSLLSHVQKAPIPIPRIFHIFLPDPDLKNLSREDVLSALVPFKRSLREVWRRETDETAAISIRHTPAINGIIVPGNDIH